MSALMAAFQPSLLSVILRGFGLASLHKFINPSIQKSRQTLYDAPDQVIANASADMHSKSLLHLVLAAEDPEKHRSSSKKAPSKRRLSHGGTRDNYHLDALVFLCPCQTPRRTRKALPNYCPTRTSRRSHSIGTYSKNGVFAGINYKKSCACILPLES